jgi:excisionase family DNA binding protein
MKEKFFTTEQVANILQVHPFTILKFIKQGKLKGIKLGRIYRIKESDINKFLEDRMTPGAKGSEKPKATCKETNTFQSETSKKEVKQEKKKKHYELDKKDEENHYYII